MSVRMRQFVEREVISALLDTVFKVPGVKVYVSDEGNFDLCPILLNKRAVLKVLFARDEEHIKIKYTDETGKVVAGIVWLIYGNDGYDVISDYSVNLEHLMVDAHLVADYWDSDGPYVTFEAFKRKKLDN